MIIIIIIRDDWGNHPSSWVSSKKYIGI
jgi:hypothetical protein